MSIPLPEISPLPRLRVLAVGTAVDPITEQEVCWHSISGITYQIRYRDDLNSQTYTVLPTVYQGDGTLKSVVFPVNSPEQRFYELVEHVPKGFNVVVAWDGTYVLLERWPIEPGHKHHLSRDGQFIGDILSDTLSFKDSGVSSGARPVYTAEAYGS